MNYLKIFSVFVFIYGLCAVPASASLDDSNRYLQPNMENFSKLYWRLGMMDPEIDEQVDNYMAINEGDIYKDYKYNELEWRDIRNSARKMLIKSAPKFGTRFSIMQEIRLKDYDFERGGFYILDEYKVDTTKRFEVIAAETSDKICVFSRYINHYPRGIILELSRPFEMDFIPVHDTVARAYIEETMVEFRNVKEKYQNEENLYDKRLAYMEINVKLFSFTGFGRSDASQYLAKVIGVLESVKVYADRKRTTLLFAKTYGKRQKQDGVDPVLKRQFEAFLARREKIPVLDGYDTSIEN